MSTEDIPDLPDLDGISRERLDALGSTVLACAIRSIQDGDRQPSLPFNSGI
jgi:hypothetical protein